MPKKQPPITEHYLRKHRFHEVSEIDDLLKENNINFIKNYTKALKTYIYCVKIEQNEIILNTKLTNYKGREYYILT